MKKKIYILYFIIIGLLFISGCGSSGGGNGIAQVSEVSGTITLPSDATGKCMAVVLDRDANPDNDNDADYTAGAVSGATITYKFSNVPDGTYYILSVVDVDRSGGTDCDRFTEHDFFNAGDCVGYYGGKGLDPPGAANVPVPHDEGLTYNFSLEIYTGGVPYLDNWNVRTSGTALDLRAVMYGSNTFVVAGNRGTILTSPDGDSWTERNTGTSSYLEGVTHGQGIFHVVGFDGKYLTSVDGISWTLKRLATPSDYFYDITYGNNTFVAVGGYYDALMFASRTIFISPDGLTWTEKTSPVSTRFNLGVTYGGNTFVVVGSSGTIFTSPDGNTWTTRSSGTTVSLHSAAYGSNTCVIVGRDGTILTSPDGITWTARNSGTNVSLSEVTYGNDTFVAVGGSGTIQTSSDGLTWTSRSSGTHLDLNGVTYGNGTFVAVGDDGLILQSD